ncbi:MAG: flagellar filament capping protein FliD [Spirochaetales bacterium]|nr:flagellar filament capping protein FliD [Spirochaetales bacterium]
MSDISIPGVTSKLQTDKMIEKLMELERVPLERLEADRDLLEDQKKVWRDVTQRLSSLRDTARTLYGFENPFQSRIANSDDEGVLTATATRQAAFDSSSVQVIQTAGADRFLSASLPDDYKVPEGTYRFTVGEKEISFNYNGGSLNDFASSVNRRGKDLLRAQVVKDTSKTSVILIESLVSGEANRLGFSETAETFALESGILREMKGDSREIQPALEALRRWSNPLQKELFQSEGGFLLATPGAEASLPIQPGLSSVRGLYLEMEVRFTDLGGDATLPPSPPPGPDIPPGGSVTFQGITVDSASSRIELPEWTPPEPPKRVDDPAVLFLQSGDRVVGLPVLQLTEAPQTIRIALDDYVDSVDALLLRNRNTHRNLQMGPVRIFDPTARGDYAPANVISEARNSIVSFEGIQVVRETNSIDDLIPGVTLNLKKASDDPVSLEIEPDRESVKEQLITFVGYYNQLLATIQILTSSDEEVIDEISYFTDEEREAAEEQLGLYQGDTTLLQLKSRLQTIMMNAYETSAGRELALLSQIGIATNVKGLSGGFDSSRLRGYLEIDEKTLDAALESNLEAVAQLFGRDTDNDLIVDAGAAYALESYVRPYVETGGIISYKITSLDSQIDRTDRDIVNYEAKLVAKEEELRRKYGMMEGAINALESSSQDIENLNRTFDNSR